MMKMKWNPKVLLIVFVDAQSISPWLSSNTLIISNMLCFLHNEIIDFAEYVQPMKEETMRKSETFERIRELFEENIEGAIVKSFGSFATEMSLRNSDIDITLMHSQLSSKKLMKIAYILIKAKEVEYDCIEIIKNAKVPLIKLDLKAVNNVTTEKKSYESYSNDVKIDN